MNKFALFSCLSLLAGAVVADDSGPIRNGSTYYSTLQVAFGAAKDGDTIEILEDIDEAGVATGGYYDLTKPNFTTQGLTINAHEHTITVGFAGNDGTPIFVFVGNKVTVNGGTWVLSDKVGYNDSGKMFYASNATMTLNGVTVDSTAAIGECIAVDADGGSSVTVSGATIRASFLGTGHVGASLSVGGSVSKKRIGTAIIQDSVVEGNIALLYGVLTLTGSTTVSGTLMSDDGDLTGRTIKKSENIALSPIAGYKWSAPDSDGLQTLVKAENAQTITIGSVGVTQITSTLKNTIVAVSFADLEAGGDIKVADLVKTDNLTEGDQLAIFNGGSTYDTWTLQGGAWVKNDKTFTQGSDGLLEGTGTAADEATKVVGTGFWLCRKNQPSGQFTFYTYGKPVDTKTSTIQANTVTLVGNPTQQNVNLNDAGKVEGARFADYIMTIEDGVPQYYMYNGSGWGRNSDSGVVTLPAVAPGHGFWIQTKANATINW